MLLEVVRADPSSDVVATAIVVLAKRKYPMNTDFLRTQTARSSWYDEITIACLNAIEELKAREQLPMLQEFSGQSFNQSVRSAALAAWAVCVPGDPELHKALSTLAESGTRVLQLKAIELLGTVGATESIGILRKIVNDDFDADMTVEGRKSIAALERIMSAQ